LCRVLDPFFQVTTLARLSEDWGLRCVATKQRIREAPVGGDGSSVPNVGAVTFGLSGFRVLAAGRIGAALVLLVETTASTPSCPGCGRAPAA
jgi:hypothetical protein